MILRKLISSAGLYALAFLLPRVLRLVVIPIVATVVGFETYGVFVMLTLIVALGHVLAELGTGTAAMRLAPNEGETDRASLFSSALVLRLSFALAILASIVIARRSIAHVLVGERHAWAVPWVGVTMVVFTLGVLFTDRLRSEERHPRVAGLVAVSELTDAGTTFLFVVVFKLGLFGLLLGRLVADVVLMATLAASGRGVLSARPQRRFYKPLLTLGVPIAALYFLVIFREVDRYMIKTVLGVADVGRYDLALRIVGPVALGNAALTMVLEPHVYRTYQEPGAVRSIAMFLRAYVVLFGLGAFTIGVIAPEVLPLLTPDRDPRTAVLAPALIFSFVAEGVLRVAGIGGDLAKRTSVWAYAAVVHLCVALPLTWFLLRPLGLWAAGFALVAATIVSAEVARALSERLFPLDLPVHRALLVVAVGVGLATLTIFVHLPLWARLSSVPLFAAFAWVTSGLRASDLADVVAEARRRV